MRHIVCETNEMVDTVEPITMCKELELLQRFHRSHCTSIGLNGYDHWRNIFFTEAAFVRLGNIIGYAMACWDCGQKAFANKFARGIVSQLDRMNESENLLEHYAETKHEKEFLHSSDAKYMPFRRVILMDDGTKFGFGFSVYYCLPPSVADAYRSRVLARVAVNSVRYNRPYGIKDSTITNEFMTSKDRYRVYKDELSKVRCEQRSEWFKESLQKQFSIDSRLTQRYSNWLYRYSYNGGLLYHGPGGDNVFAVDIGRNSQSAFWSTHT